MAEIEIMPLSERLNEDEIADLIKAIEELGGERFREGNEDASTTVSEGLDDDVLAEFLDRLEAHDMACDVYLPAEFEGRVEVANVRVGSAPALVDVLEEMRDELFATEEESDDEDEDGDDDFADDHDEEAAALDGKLRHVWKLLFHGAQAAIDRSLPLHIQA